MTSDVVLTAALRNNLLSLQNTQRLIDSTQLKLATGLKINSALDNPQNFFAAQALGNRASDLSLLLDGIGQSISTIKAADQGIQSLTKLVEQATSLATTALEASSGAAAGASITGDVDVEDLAITAATAGTLTFTFTDSEGYDVSVTGGTVTIANGEGIEDIINNINAIRDGNGDKIVVASLTDSNRLKITTLNGNNARLELVSTGTATLAGTQVLSGSLGLSSILTPESALTPAGTTSTSVAANLIANASISSGELYRNSSDLAQRSTLLDDLVRDSNNDGTIGDQVLTFAGDAGADTYFINIGVNGGAAAAIAVTAAGSTVQSLVDAVNNNVIINARIEASFDESTGRITFAAKDGGVQSVQFSVSATESANTNAQLVADFGFGAEPALDSTVAGATGTEYSNVETYRFGVGGGDIAQARADFNKLREQIDALIDDSGYRGVNLLNGDDLVTTFNEDRTNQLTTEGSILTASGLGIDEASFSTRNDIIESLDQTRAALLSVRSFGSSIANDLAIIQTREDFTKNIINNLQEGRDKLVVADQNEEGANLLALQTRQALGTTSLSLASQSQQSVLRLF